MPRRTKTPNAVKLNTISASPMALVKGYATSLVTMVRSTVETVQLVASTIKSVDVLSDDVQVNLAPENVDPRALLRLPVGQQTVGLRGDVNVERSGQDYVVTLKLDAYLLDQALGRKLGGLVSHAACRFNTKIKIAVRDTIDADVVHSPVPLSNRIAKR